MLALPPPHKGFDYWAANFGAPSSGGCDDDAAATGTALQPNRPSLYQCILQPSPPWSAAVMSAPPGAAAGRGGLLLLLVVPEGAAAALRTSRVLCRLAEGCMFH
jgi:hypothetical protein